MSITSERIRELGFIHELVDDAVDEIEKLERENAELCEIVSLLTQEAERLHHKILGKAIRGE